MKEQGKGTDPGAFFKQYMGDMEDTWSKMWDQLVSSTWYAKFQGSLMDAILTSQQASQSSIKMYLDGMNIPTKEDLARVAYQVVQNEQKIDQLQRELDRLSNLEAKLDLVLAAIKRLEGSGEKKPAAANKQVTAPAEPVQRAKKGK
ncbi:MAG TPA: hypothetical protein VHS59_11625 [Bacillota bacterium]|nr:hypothetical protein [Bacillota bacterium]